jgi:hypothetical protein
MERLIWVIANNAECCHEISRLKSNLIWGFWDRPGGQVLFRHPAACWCHAVSRQGYIKIQKGHSGTYWQWHDISAFHKPAGHNDLFAIDKVEIESNGEASRRLSSLRENWRYWCSDFPGNVNTSTGKTCFMACSLIWLDNHSPISMAWHDSLSADSSSFWRTYFR